MKIVVSYLNSSYSVKDTIDIINKTSAYGIHVDLMDGTYVGEKNFEIGDLAAFFKDNKKPLDFHLMVNNPSNYLEKIYELKPECIYIHPKTEKNPVNVLRSIKSKNILTGIAINPDEDVALYEEFFHIVNRVLLMSVYPGRGGQTFLKDTSNRLKILKGFQKKYHFEIFVDGGVNNKNLREILPVDGAVVGSYICKK